MNNNGLKFIAERTRSLHINSMAKAEKAIHERLLERDARIAAGKPLSTDSEPSFARGLAWVIGFDQLIEDRKAIGDFVEKIVQP